MPMRIIGTDVHWVDFPATVPATGGTPGQVFLDQEAVNGDEGYDIFAVLGLDPSDPAITPRNCHLGLRLR